MQDFYQDKLALITGGSSGIGFEVSKLLLNLGCSVIIMARNEQKLETAKQKLESAAAPVSQHVYTCSVDVADHQAVEAAAKKIITSIGIPNFLFNFAGVARPGYIEDLPLDVFRWTMNIDYHGTVNVVKAFLPAFIQRKNGFIINVSSMAGVIGVFGYTAYSGAKFAVRGFSDALRSEMKPKGIHVSIVFPPDTDTPQLSWESQYKPPETAIIAGSDKPLSAEYVAEVIVRDLAKKKYQIIPGAEAKILFWLSTHFGSLVYPVLDFLIRSARKKKNATRNND